MKIIEINIQNFGKLSNFNLKLDQNFHQILEDNGFGKTTLMNFIKAMFFGISKEQRSTYSPWNKGTFGGYLIFSKDDTKYRIERTFGTRNALNTTRLFNLQTMQELESENIGEQFFGIDEKTFSRLLYVDENFVSAPSTSVLIGKLTKLSQNQQVVTSSFESAKELLKAKKSYLTKTNGRGMIQETSSELATLKRELENANNNFELSTKFTNEIQTLAQKENFLKNNIIQIDAKIELATKQQANTQNLKQLNFLLNEKQTLETRISQIKNKFPLGFPTSDSIASYAEKLTDLTSLQTLLEHNLSQLNENQELNPTQNQIARQNQDQPSLSPQDLASFQSKKQKAINLISSASNTPQSNKINLSSPKTITSLSLSALSLALIILGLIFSTTPLTITATAIFVFSMFLALVFALKPAKDPNKKLLNEINSLLFPLTFSSVSEALAELNKIELNLTKQNELTAQIKDLKQNISRLEGELTSFNENFNLSSNSFSSCLDEIKNHISTHASLQEDLTKIETQISTFEKLETSNEAPLNLEQLKAEKEKLNADYESTKNSIIELTNKKNVAENSAENLDLLKTKITTTQEQLNDFTRDLFVTEQTLKLLEEAKTILTSKYITPTENRLNDLASNFPNTKKYLPLRLTEDLEVMFEENNTLQNAPALSTGLNHTFALLTRVSLINTIFENQSVPIFLDDPFQSLDANNLNSMKSLLKTLAKDNQILYFSCSKERGIE